MKPISFFKLPLIFIAIYAVISIGWITINLFNQTYDEIIFYFFTGLLLSKLFSLSLFFTLAIFLCKKYRLHTLNTQNLFIILSIAIIFSLLSFGWHYAFHFVSSPVNKLWLELGISWITYYFNLVVSYIVQIIIMLVLFKIVAGNYVSQQQEYILDQYSGKCIYAAVYSLILLTLSLIWFRLDGIALMLQLHDFYVAYYSELDSLIYFILPIAILVILFNYWFIYTSTHNCFENLPDSLKIKPLLKSIALAIVFLIIFSIIAGIILGLVGGALLMSSSSYRYYDTIPFSLIIFAFFVLIVNYWLLYLSTRMGVRIVFAQKATASVTSDQSSTP